MANIPAALADWSATAASNQPDDADSILLLPDDLQQLQATMRAELATRGTIAAATTTSVGGVAAGTVTVTGSGVSITSLGTVSAGLRRTLVFADVNTLVHNATSLDLISDANITTAAGDVAEFESLGSGNWKCLGYARASGQIVASSIQFPDGTEALPGVAWVDDTDSGLRRAGPDSMGMSLGGTQRWLFQAAGSSLTGTLAVSGAVDFASGLKVGTSDAWTINADGSFAIAPTADSLSTIALASSASSGFRVYTSAAEFKINHAGGGGSGTLKTPVPFTFNLNGNTYWAFDRAGTGTALRIGDSAGSNAGIRLTVVETIGKPTVSSGGGTGSSVSGNDIAFKVTLGTGPSTTLVMAWAFARPNPPIVVCSYGGVNNCIVKPSTVTTSGVTFTFSSAPEDGGVVHVHAIDFQTS